MTDWSERLRTRTTHRGAWPEVLRSAGATGSRVADHPWERTPLGAIETWPQTLRTAVLLVLESSVPSILYWGPELTALYNDAYRPLLGDKPDPLGAPFETVWTESLDEIGPVVERALAGEPSGLLDSGFVLERFGRRERAWFVWSFTPVRDECGAVVGVLNQTLETTGSAGAGPSPVATAGDAVMERRYHALVDASARLVWVVDPRGALVDASPSWRAFTGQDPATATAAGWLETLHPEDRDRVELTWRRALAGREPVEYEVRVRRHDGAYRSLQVRAVPYLDDAGAVRGWVCLASDVEAQQRDAEALRVSEARFRGVFEGAPIPMALMTLRDEVLDVNEAFARATGYRREELVGRSARALGFWSSGGDAAAQRSALAGDQSLLDIPVQFRTKAGQVREALLSLARVDYNGTGALVKMLVDVTARRSTERELALAIEEAMQDASWLTSNVLDKLAKLGAEEAHGPGLEAFTTREREVLALLARARTNEAIAEALGLAPSTVRNYVSTIYSKLGVTSRTEAVVWARSRGLGS